MELKLQQYIDSMATLGDIRNLDKSNPVVVMMNHPTLGTPYVTVASLVEPSYLGVPINTTWVVLDPNNPYYKKALKLKDPDGPTSGTVPNAITDGGLHLSWIEEMLYSEIFSDAQYYVLDIAQGPQGPIGPQGPEGPIGPAGVQGPAPDVDYNYIIGEILGQINQGTYLNIVGPTQVIEGLNGQYSLELVTTAGNTPVTGQISIASPISGVTINSSNLLSIAANSLTADVNLTLTATYNYLGQPYTATKVITLKNAVPLSLQASGLPGIVNEGTTGQITVLAVYSNGASVNVTNQCVITPTNSSALSVNAQGQYTAMLVSSDTPVTVNITFVEGSTVLTAALNTVVKNIIPTGLTITGPSTVNEQTTANYVATVTYSDGSTQNVTASADFSISDPALGSFSLTTKGLFTAADVISDTSGNVDATFTASGVTVNAIKTITVLSNQVGIRPYYDVAPLTSTKDGAFILSLTGRGSSASQVGTFSLDSGAPGSGITMFYAYPVAYGLAKFEDAANPGFYGGWDGAQGDPSDPQKWGPITVQVDVGGGNMVDFYLYQTDYDGLGPVTWNVTVGP